MGKLIYSMITSLDGYVRDTNGDFDWGTPDEEVHAFVNEQYRSVGRYLYGRRMYETMLYWETADREPDQDPVAIDYARLWQRAEKVVYSTTLAEVSSARTRVERSFDPEIVRREVADADHDVTVDGPTLAASAIRAGVVDEYHLIVTPVVVGGGLRFLPDDVRIDLELVDEHRFRRGVVFLRYRRR